MNDFHVWTTWRPDLGERVPEQRQNRSTNRGGHAGRARIVADEDACPRTNSTLVRKDRGQFFRRLLLNG